MFKIFGDSGIDLAFVIIFSLFTLLWALSVCITNVSIVDMAWGAAYTIQVFIYYFCHEYNWQNLLVLILVGLHGARLAIFITYRNAGHGEDPRYQDFRRRMGGDKHYWWVSFFQVFVLQAVINLGVGSVWGLFILRTSLDRIHNKHQVTPVEPITALMIIGAIITFAGTLMESIADFELYNHKNDPEMRGKLLTTGTWSLCRHPNYFGETLFWWGTYFWSCAVGQYWAIYGPVVMTLLIVFVSGVAILEDGRRKEKYGEAYEEYVSKTKKFIPFIW